MPSSVDPTFSIARGPSEPAVLDETLGALLRRIAAQSPDQLALVASRDGRQWTYAQLLTDAEAVARALLKRFEPGERVAIWAQNHPEWVVAEFALALAGMPIVTINPNFGGDEAAYVLTQSGSVAVLASTHHRGRDLTSVAEQVRHQCPDLREIVPLEELGEWALGEEGDRADLPAVSADDLVMIQYTSGTTGFPKGAMLHHRGIATNGFHTMERNRMTAGDVVLGAMPLFHTGGSVLAVLGSVANGGTLVLIDEFDPGHVLDTIERYGVGVLSGVPTMLLALLEHPSYDSRDLSSVKVITSGGATVPAPLVERLERELGAPFTIVFGQTELSPVCTMTRPDDSTEDKANTLGQPMPHVEVKIVDATGATVPHGIAGELCARGYLTMLGYNGDPEATSATIDEDGWLHTGDVCSMDDRGYCKIVGRIKDMVIRGGENIYPAEIEDVLFSHPAVAEAAVVGLPDDRWGEVVAAFIRPASDTPPSTAELHDFVRQHLAAHKTPAHWFRVDEFPLTGSGKIQKFRLVESWQTRTYTPLDD